MIESKDQLVGDFHAKARAFLDTPNLMTGIDFDDASVRLKRYVLSELHDQELGSLLARFPRLIREMDVATLTGLVTEIQDRIRGGSCPAGNSNKT